MLVGAIPSAQGEVRLPQIFSHNMVLQQDRDVPVWGWADPGEKVSVSFAGREASTTTSPTGRWMLKLRVPPANGKPGTLVVQGRSRVVLNNVVAGEVWLCSGQSNMQFELRGASNAKEAIAGANFPMIRLFGVRMWAAAQPQQDLHGAWTVCSPDTTGGISAVGFFLGRRLHQDLKVPVGLIDSTSGGTAAEAWISQSTLEADPVLKSLVRPNPEFFKLLEQYDRDWAEWQKAQAEKRPTMCPKSPFRGWGYPTSSFYNAMIAPLVPFPIKGVAWYQGEARTGRSQQYGHEFSALIRDWRSAWGEQSTFLVVQLPAIQPKWDWQITREQQDKVARTVPRVGLVVTIDVGDPGDLHSRNKEPIGDRLARAAEAIAYGRDVAYSGPVYDTMTMESGRIRLRFTSSGHLAAQGGGELKGFTIAGAEQKFRPAQAVIEHDTVVVSSPGMTRPVAVRYAFEDNPVCNLSDATGLPARPFRTDAWPCR